MRPNARIQEVRHGQTGALIRAVLLPRAALCSSCIAHKATLSRTDAEDALLCVPADTVESTLAACHACLKHTVVHRLV